MATFKLVVFGVRLQGFRDLSVSSVDRSKTNIRMQPIDLSIYRKTLRDTAAPSVWCQEVFVRDVLMIYF